MTTGAAPGPVPQPAEALFAATSAGTLSLLIGDAAHALGDVIMALGGSVVSAGTADVPGEPETRIAVHCDQRLPFADASFDSVFALFLSLPERAGHDRAGLARAFGEECARVLKPGGRLVLSVINPRLRAALAVAALLNRGPLRSLLSAALEAKLRFHPARPAVMPHGQRRITRLLRRAGFTDVAVYAMWPRAGTWSILVPDSAERIGGRLQHARAERSALRRAARFLGAAPARFVVAQMPASAGADARPAGTPVLEKILSDTEWNGSTVSTPAIRMKGQSVALTTVGDAFCKVALTPGAAARQRAEMATHSHLGEGVARHLMVELRRTAPVGALHFAVHAAADAIDTSDETALIAALAEAFDLLAEGAGMRPLDSTATWRRIFSAGSRDRLEYLGGSDLCAHMHRAAAGKSVLAGNVHGDLHHENVMRLEGRTVLVDWDRFEHVSPLIIDRCNAVHRLMARRLRASHGEDRHLAVLDLLARRDASVPLLSYIDEAVGELAWTEVVLLHVLSASSWRLAAPSGRQAAAERDVRAYLRFGAGLID